MAAEMRLLLDQLLGVNRDGDLPEFEVNDFRDPRVCKDYLLGFCVHDMFEKTDFDQGPCRFEVCGIRADKLKEEYGLSFEASSESFPEWEDMFVANVGRVLGEVERYKAKHASRVERAHGVSRGYGESGGGGGEVDPVIAERAKKAEAEAEAAEKAVSEAEAEAARFKAEAEEKLAAAEAAGEEGEVDESLRLSEEADALRNQEQEAMGRAERSRREARQSRLAANQARSMALSGAGGAGGGGAVGREADLRVCQDCGKMLSVKDSDSRLAEHFKGRMHNGVVRAREALEAVRARMRERNAATHTYGQRDHRLDADRVTYGARRWD